MDDVIVKIGESASGRKSSVWRDLLAAVNRFLLKMGLGRQINKHELADLVEGSLKRVMAGKGPDGGPGGGRSDNSDRAVRKGSDQHRDDDHGRIRAPDPVDEVDRPVPMPCHEEGNTSNSNLMMLFPIHRHPNQSKK